MTVREDAQWSLVVPTSMGVRITPENRAPVPTAARSFLQPTSPETNHTSRRPIKTSEKPLVQKFSTAKTAYQC